MRYRFLRQLIVVILVMSGLALFGQENRPVGHMDTFAEKYIGDFSMQFSYDDGRTWDNTHACSPVNTKEEGLFFLDLREKGWVFIDQYRLAAPRGSWQVHTISDTPGHYKLSRLIFITKPPVDIGYQR